MNDVTLITVDDIKEVTSISKNIQSELLQSYILLSEEYFAYPVLGDALVTEIKNQLTGNSLTYLNQILLIQYVRPLIGYGAWHEYIPFGTVKSTQAGEVRQHSEKSDTASLEEVEFKRNALKDKITFFQGRLKDYLEANADSYPLFRSTCKTNNINGTGIYLGKYN